MARRDRDDSTRADSPLTLDERYTVVDSTGKPIPEVVAEIEKRVRETGGYLTPRAPQHRVYFLGSNTYERGPLFSMTAKNHEGGREDKPMETEQELSPQEYEHLLAQYEILSGICRRDKSSGAGSSELPRPR